MKTVLTLLVISLAMQTTSPSKKRQEVLEVVIYKINKEYDGDMKRVLNQVRSAVYEMPGFVSYNTFSSSDKELVYMDLVKWKSAEEAKAAALKVTQLEEFTEFEKAISDIMIMDHLEFYH